MNSKSNKECVYNVKGMHCASCEVLIERKLIKQSNIEAVEASTAKGRVIVEYSGSKPSITEINKLFKEEKYSFSEAVSDVKPPIKEVHDPLLIIREDGIRVNIRQLMSLLFITTGLVVVFIIYRIFERLGLASFISVSAASALPAFFFFGIAAGFSSCAALVGGIVLSMSKQWYELHSNKNSFSQKIQPHLLFNLGRIISFALLGGVLGAIGSIFSISPIFTSVVAILVAVMMVLMGGQMLGIKAFQRFQFTVPKGISRYIADESNFAGKYMPFIMGALTFFLPCGFTITAQGLALVSGSPIRGALMMSLFALGTSPMLLFIGMSSTKLYEKAQVAENFIKLVGILVMIFGFTTINSQFVTLGLPNLNDITFNKSYASTSSTNLPTATAQNEKSAKLPEIVDGKQMLKMEANSSGYVPNNLTVRVGVPVRWEITNNGAAGCTNAIIARSLFDGQIPLPVGEVAVKEFTPTKTGKFRFSCWMGMVSGVIEVVDAK